MRPVRSRTAWPGRIPAQPLAAPSRPKSSSSHAEGGFGAGDPAAVPPPAVAPMSQVPGRQPRPPGMPLQEHRPPCNRKARGRPGDSLAISPRAPHAERRPRAVNPRTSMLRRPAPARPASPSTARLTVLHHGGGTPVVRVSHGKLLGHVCERELIRLNPDSRLHRPDRKAIRGGFLENTR